MWLLVGFFCCFEDCCGVGFALPSRRRKVARLQPRIQLSRWPQTSGSGVQVPNIQGGTQATLGCFGSNLGIVQTVVLAAIWASLEWLF